MKLEGMMFFPLTPFSEGEVNRPAFAEHLESAMPYSPGGVFVACGTGELHALSASEQAAVVSEAVSVVAGRAPVVAGVGGSVGTAVEQAVSAASAGADGLLALPPYLVVGTQAGYVDYVSAIAEASGLPTIAYQRSGVVLQPDTVVRLAEHPLIAGLKDGTGNLDLVQRQVLAVERSGIPDFTFFNGMPTAETTVLAYRTMGIDVYSSAALAFVPEIATAFYRSTFDGDGAVAHKLLDVFFAPLVQLRDTVPGYAVSLVKAGAHLRGQDVGGVRPPLIDPSTDDLAELGRIIEAGLEVAGLEAVDAAAR
jgi:5-dehydro-4-deoxyglucarate dehydratase